MASLDLRKSDALIQGVIRAFPMLPYGFTVRISGDTIRKGAEPSSRTDREKLRRLKSTSSNSLQEK